MKILILISLSIALLVTIAVSINKSNNKSAEILDSCKVSANLNYADSYDRICSQRGIVRNCTLDRATDVGLLQKRDKFINDCVVNLSLSSR